MSHPSSSGLTPRERDLVVLCGAGWTRAWIANALGISRSTVRNEIGHLYRKFGVRGDSRSKLMRLLLELNRRGEIKLTNG